MVELAARAAVRQRAGGRCEYCRLPESLGEIAFHVEHIDEDMVARAADRQSRPRSANKEGCPDYSRRLAVRRCADQLIPNSAHGRH